MEEVKVKSKCYKNGYELLSDGITGKVHDCSDGSIIYVAPIKDAEEFFINITE